MTSQSPSQLVKSNHICDKNEGMRSTFLSQCDRRKQVTRHLLNAQNKITTSQTSDTTINCIATPSQGDKNKKRKDQCKWKLCKRRHNNIQ